MRAALDGVDIVGVGEHRLVKGVGPLQRDFDIDALAHALEEDHVVERLVALAERLDELRDAALVVKFLVLAVALVVDANLAARR